MLDMEDELEIKQNYEEELAIVPEHLINQYRVVDVARCVTVVRMQTDPEHRHTNKQIAEKVMLSDSGLAAAMKRWKESGLMQQIYDLIAAPIIATKKNADLIALQKYPEMLNMVIADAVNPKTSAKTRGELFAMVYDRIVKPTADEAEAETDPATATYGSMAGKRVYGTSADVTTIRTKTSKTEPQ